jgi:hypothetical protein
MVSIYYHWGMNHPKGIYYVWYLKAGSENNGMGNSQLFKYFCHPGMRSIYPWMAITTIYML